MQNELSTIIDKLSCDSLPEINQGLDSIEKLLKALAPSIRKFHQTAIIDTKLSPFIALQSNFQYNITTGLISVYQFISKHSPEVSEDVLIRTNYLLSGILLIHPESRSVFSRGKNMALMLSFLDSETSLCLENLSVSFVSLLIHILIKNVKNMRVFEENNGCQILIHRLNMSPVGNSGNSNTGGEGKILHFKVIEFLIFYLADESELLNLLQNVGVRSMSVKEKADLFRPKFLGIDDLITSLNDLTSLRTIPNDFKVKT